MDDDKDAIIDNLNKYITLLSHPRTIRIIFPEYNLKMHTDYSRLDASLVPEVPINLCHLNYYEAEHVAALP